MPSLVTHMSKIGRQPVPIPEKVTAKIAGDILEISGPKGNLTLTVHPEVTVAIEANQLVVRAKKSDKFSRSLHGLTKALIANMVEGVTQGFEKRLELVGTGYRVQQQGKNLRFSLGFSHEVEFPTPEGVEVKAEGQNKIVVTGSNKQLVGQAAADIRALRSPEPYKGKGIRYEGEVVRRKAGKQVKAAE